MRAEPFMSDSQKTTVLVVDDHEDLLIFVKRILERADYQVFSAGSGEKALELAAKMVEPLELLVTDLLLPGITGGELRDRIRELHPRCAAIYISGVNQKRIDELGLKYGATFLRKPFTAQQLLEAAELKLTVQKAAFAT
jgi:two-component system cell cycle sensor histidine kinase/response regulator CckA